MTDALTLLKTRRSVSARMLRAPGPDKAQLETLIEIACRVPDHGKLAPWRFIVIEGAAAIAGGAGLEALLSKRGETDPQRLEFARAAFTRAPLVIAVVSKAAPHPKIPVWEQELSVGAACFGLCIAAHALGFAANWLTDWFAYDEDALALLGVRAPERVAGFVHIGTASETPVDRPRPAFHDAVTFFGG